MLIGPFDWKDDTIAFANGWVDGAVGVFPDESMITYCKNNLTEAPENADAIYD